MKVLPILLFIFAFSFTIFAQIRITGRVGEIINGKTIKIETSDKSKFTVELQFIEVPEFGQPLADVVKGHLQKLALGKTVLFQTKGLSEGNRLIGRVLIGNIDLSEQMLRDGAAWYAILEKDLQDSTEREVYQNTESTAKSEKRGVWGVEGLKPSWEFRAEKQASRSILATQKAELIQPPKKIQKAQISENLGEKAGSAKFLPKSLKLLSTAQDFFEECSERGKNFDITVVECYSDKAIIQNTRRYPNGNTQLLQFSAAEWKKSIVKAIPIAKQLSDYSIYSNITYTTEGKRIRINATRYSARKKYYSPISILVGRDSSGSWKVYEEMSESQP